MKGKLLSVVIIVLLSTIVFSGCNEKSNSENNGKTTTTLTALETFQDIATSFDNCTMKNYKSFNDGDVITIRDIISEISYVDYKVPSYTEVTLPVSEIVGLYFLFEGDITTDYNIDDTVQISFHIKHVNFTIYDETLKKDFCFDLEIPEEGFNQSYCEETRDVIMPQSCISHI